MNYCRNGRKISALTSEVVICVSIVSIECVGAADWGECRACAQMHTPAHVSPVPIDLEQAESSDGRTFRIPRR